MERVFRFTRRLLGRTCLGLGAAAAVVGCHKAYLAGGKPHGHDCAACKVDNCADIPKGAIPLPVGTFTSEFFLRQSTKAEADDFVIYYNEWVDNQAVLGPYGADHLCRIIARLPSVPFPVIVQPEPSHPTLTALRHKTVVEALVNAGFPDALERVKISRSEAEGLFGDEAERIYPQLVRGGFGGGGGGFGGGFGGGGFGGGGFGGFGGGGGNIGFGGGVVP